MFWVWLPTAHNAAPSRSATKAPIRAHAAIPLAICWSAALPGSADVDGERLTLANNMVFSLSRGERPTVAGATPEALSARMVGCSLRSPPM